MRSTSPAATSASISNITTSASGFTLSVLEPDTALPADGEYDILSTAATSAFPTPFQATFDDSGTGTPGAQQFTLYDSSFATITTGTTTGATTATPEPGSFVLLLVGSAVLLLCMRARPKVKAVARCSAFPAIAAMLITLPGAIHAQPPTGGGPPGGTPPTSGGPGGGSGGSGTATAISGMTIGPYKLLSSYRASFFQYYYTYATSVTNTNTTPYTYVLGTLTSSSANTVVVSGSVEFGLVPAGGTASSLDAFTILQDRRSAFDPSSLSWSFTASTSSSTVGTTPSTVIADLCTASDPPSAI